MLTLQPGDFWWSLFLPVLFGLLICGTRVRADEPPVQSWAQWRGPYGTGVAPGANPPVEWDDDNNIRWKAPLPGLGHSTPVIWRDKIFVTTAISYGERLKPRLSGRPGAHDNVSVSQHHEYVVLALGRMTGKVIWRQVVHKNLPHEGGHYTASLASASPITDGERVFAFFGSHGLFCLDVDGKLIWQMQLGKMHTKHGHGEGSSPALYGDTLIVNWDHEGQSFVVALDKRNGRQLWRLDRKEVTSWATPIVVEHNGRPQVVVCGTDRVRGYDLETGKIIWQCGGMSANIVATPVSADGVVFVGSSYEKRAMLAINLDGAKGDITGTDKVLWSRFRGTPYVPSPLLYGNALYFLTHYQGILSRVSAKTGEDRPGAFRLGAIRNVYASPVAAADRIYITDLDGTTAVLSHGDIPRLLSINRLNDSFSASAAIVGRELFLRGKKHLYCIAKE